MKGFALVGCWLLWISTFGMSAVGLDVAGGGDDTDEEVILRTTIKSDTHEEACVTLLDYGGNRQCHGSNISDRTYTTWTSTGSPCKHTDAMNKNSVTDQYCEFDSDGNVKAFHQKVYVGSTKCHVSLVQKAYSPMHLTYDTHSCTYGFKLLSCTLGACPSSTTTTTTTSEDILELPEFMVDEAFDDELPSPPQLRRGA